MTQSNMERYKAALKPLEKAAGFVDDVDDVDDVVEPADVHKDDAEAIIKMCRAYDENDTRESLPSGMYENRRKDGHKKPRTLLAWVERLTEVAKGIQLSDTTADEINAWMTKRLNGEDGGGGVGKGHLHSLEQTTCKFYRFHDGLGVDPNDITVHEYNGAEWDERDMLDADERRALREVAEHPRDQAILHMLLYCGLRNTALRTLRIKDIELDDHEWYFNTTADGLKDIARPTEPRPLFQAEKAVRDWITDYHPDPKPDHYFITGKPKYGGCDPTSPVSRETIRHAVKGLKEKTHERDDVVNVDKPCHPHMLRHNFVTMCRRHPDITDADIKFFLGHSEDSSVMESTYSHLSSDDHNTAGHRAFGVSSAADDGDTVPPWDSTCHRCDRVLAPGEDTCHACNTPRGATPWDDRADVMVDIERTAGQAAMKGDEETLELATALTERLVDMDEEKQNELRELLL